MNAQLRKSLPIPQNNEQFLNEQSTPRPPQLRPAEHYSCGQVGMCLARHTFLIRLIHLPRLGGRQQTLNVFPKLHTCRKTQANNKIFFEPLTLGGCAGWLKRPSARYMTRISPTVCRRQGQLGASRLALPIKCCSRKKSFLVMCSMTHVVAG